MKKIYIDTTDNTRVLVRLTIDDETYTKEKGVETRSAQLVLPLIDELLKEHSLTPHDLDEVEVSVGPGSFTGVRVGVTIANALAFTLDIPINKTKIVHGKTQIQPKY